MIIHFIGIGGIGMSGIARMYLSLGHDVQGSDLKKTPILADLEKRGAKILIGHDAKNVEGASLVVYSSSIKENHPERAYALKNRLKIWHRSEALADLCRNKYTIAVTGTHGKTTTTALIGMILKEAERDPSIVVGGLVNSFGGNAYFGNGPEIVIEADESDSSFLNFSPSLEVITNMEEEHMDHFQTWGNVEKDYAAFLDKLPEGGSWVGCAEDENVRRLAVRNIRPAILYGFDAGKAEFYASNIQACPEGRRGISFDVYRRGQKLGRIQLRIPGQHNVLNSLAATAAGLKLGISFDKIASALEKYEGAGRRFDVQFENKDYLVVDDYAHHPTEIHKTLEAAKSLGRKRILAVFQPHRYTRTQSLLDSFAACFELADVLLVADIYAASEVPIPGVTAEKLCESIRKRTNQNVNYMPKDMMKAYLKTAMQPGDIILVMGAGDINQLAKDLARDLKFSTLKGRVLLNEPLSKHTSWKIGGPCHYWVEPQDLDDLKKALLICQSTGTPFYLMGLGSNILASDHGWEGAVIHLNSPYFREVKYENGRLLARAGAPNTLFISYALEQGLGGMEFLTGIPGCIGGAVAMNAGSHAQSVDEILESIKVLTYGGEEKILNKNQIPFSYRNSGLQDVLILEANFILPKAKREDAQKKLDEYRDYRQKTQDLQHASAGCMFKNPSLPGCSSGKLIDEAGLKGLTVGQAQVSVKHANFLINLGGASAEDVKTLMTKVQQEVYKKSGIQLETEVRFL